MKKIININLSGRVIPIEDTAYEQLQAYIESLRRHFSREEGRDEIINDIESRIAELMSEQLRKGATAITDVHIQEIIASIGRPEDFDAEFAGNQEQHHYQQQDTTGKAFSGRLYRDTSDRFLGGVCAGIANYVKIDPALIRILFAIITFGGFGMGILLYILLWIVLPPKDLEGYVGKRLFRNPDDRIIGGVAGGLAAYFNRSAWAIRIIFALPFLLKLILGLLDFAIRPWNYDFTLDLAFGSLTGTFILAYILLWIVLPEAKTPYHKMEMRGEKVDLNAFRQNVKEGMDRFKDRAEQMGEELKQSAQQFNIKAEDFAKGAETFAKEAAQVGKPIGANIGHALAVLFKAIFLIIGGSIAFALLVALLIALFGGMAWWPINDFLWSSTLQQALALGTLVLFLLVPIIGFFIWFIRRLMNVKAGRHYLGWVFSGLWILGWGCLIAFVVSIATELREYEYTSTPLPITQPSTGVMVVKVDPTAEYYNHEWWMDTDDENLDLSGDTLRYSNLKVRVLKSNDNDYHVNVLKFSAGANEMAARERADKTVFQISATDSLLNLGQGIAIDKNTKFRGQGVIVEVLVPVGKHIRFDASIVEAYNRYVVRRYYRRDYRGEWTNSKLSVEWNSDESFDWDTNVNYTMSSEGKLIDPSRPRTKTEMEDDLRERELKLEEEKRKLDEEKRRLRDDESDEHNHNHNHI